MRQWKSTLTDCIRKTIGETDMFETNFLIFSRLEMSCIIYFCCGAQTLLMKRRDFDLERNDHGTKRLYTHALSLMPPSHQGSNMFKSCLVKHSLKSFPS